MVRARTEEKVGDCAGGGGGLGGRFVSICRGQGGGGGRLGWGGAGTKGANNNPRGRGGGKGFLNGPARRVRGAWAGTNPHPPGKGQWAGRAIRAFKTKGGGARGAWRRYFTRALMVSKILRGGRRNDEFRLFFSKKRQTLRGKAARTYCGLVLTNENCSEIGDCWNYSRWMGETPKNTGGGGGGGGGGPPTRVFGTVAFAGRGRGEGGGRGRNGPLSRLWVMGGPSPRGRPPPLFFLFPRPPRLFLYVFGPPAPPALLSSPPPDHRSRLPAELFPRAPPQHRPAHAPLAPPPPTWPLPGPGPPKGSPKPPAFIYWAHHPKPFFHFQAASPKPQRNKRFFHSRKHPLSPECPA